MKGRGQKEKMKKVKRGVSEKCESSLKFITWLFGVKKEVCPEVCSCLCSFVLSSCVVCSITYYIKLCCLQYYIFIKLHIFGSVCYIFTCPFLSSKLFTEFILNVPVSRLTIQKLYCLIEIVHSDLFTQHGKQQLCDSEVVTLLIASRLLLVEVLSLLPNAAEVAPN